jgi:hypothetical protein
MFLAEATATEGNDRHKAGARRTLLVFVKQDEADANWTLCESILKSCRWSDVQFKGARVATPETVQAIQQKPEPAIEQAYKDASRKGFGILVFSQ